MAAARAEAQLESGRSELGRVLARIASGWTAALAEREVELDVRPPPAPMMAGVDAEVVERIVAPLLDHARRYARARVILRAVARDGAIVVTVADDGPGVEPEAREVLFEPGARTAGVNGHRGAGLGLPLARRLAKAIGGDVTVVPAVPGAGAQFEVRLPT
jgi:signal transduction histidine kinase